MSSRYLIALVAAAALVFACGPRGPHAAETASAEQHEQPRRHKRRAGEPTVLPALDVRVGGQEGDGVALALRLVNTTGKKVDLIFPTGRTHDFVVLDSVGREVWRWSESRMFTGALQNRTIAAGSSIAFEERWERPAGTHGRYTAVAVLASDNYPLEQRVDFTLP